MTAPLRRPVSIALAVTCAGCVTLMLLACGGIAPTTGIQPARWACPSPTPKPYGTTGPVKETIHHTQPITEGGDWDESVYYAEWEQEYGGIASGPPFPAPTPYGMVGSSYSLGQRVDLGIAHVQITARAGAKLPMQTDAAGAVYQVSYVDVAWDNHGAVPLAFNYGAQIQISAVTQPNGAIRTDSGWRATLDAFAAANIASPPAAVPVGHSAATVAIITPAGTPRTVTLTMIGATTSGGPNTDLRQADMSATTITWDAAAISVGPPCGDAGAYTAWASSSGSAWGHQMPVGIAAPAGAPRVVEIALAQVGKPYILGAKGPDVFDCSGLATWSYAQIGISIPQGTAGQWPRMRPVDAASILSGDLAFFDWEHDGRIDHVGIVADVNGDGKWDLVQAANPSLGVIVTKNFLASAYYGPFLTGFRTAR